MAGLQTYLRALIVAGRSPYPTCSIAVDRQSGDIDHAAPDAFVGFALTSNTQCERIAHKFIGIKGTDTVSVGDAGQIAEVDDSVDLIERLALQHAPYQGFRRRTVARRIFSASAVYATGCGDGRHLLEAFSGERLTIVFAQCIDLLPETFGIGTVGHFGFETCPDKRRAYLGDIF